MNQITQKIRELALKADRKLLSLEEEEYYRLDFSAYEGLTLSAIGLNIDSKSSGAISIKDKAFGFWRFLITATVIFAIMFSLSNFGAYSQIFKAEITSYNESKTESNHVPVVNPTQSGDVSITDTLQNGIMPLTISVASYDDRIRIPKMDIDVPFHEPTLALEDLKANDWNELEEKIRKSLLSGPVHYPGTAQPGQKGNVFITGHSSNVFWEPSPYNSVFALLPKLETGDDIFITKDQKEFHYKVIAKKEVTPKETSVLAQGDQFHLTLMTCTPVGTNLKRLVVTAELVS